ncbi:MAG: RHS repeat-associated core domain-containing protein [Flavobacteriales bacterium]|jgi:RHS repeat-associated protein
MMMQNYRFGFNGMEKDDEVYGSTGTSYDFGARLYDPRVGRWLSTDPLAIKYPSETPYGFAGGNPLFFIDMAGQYKLPAREQQKSKMFTAYLKKGIAEVLKSDVVMNALMKQSQLSRAQIIEVFKWDSGPSVEIVKRDGPFDVQWDGNYTGGKNGTIQINESLINQLNSASDEDKQAALLYVVSTLLHETVHYGDNQDGDIEDNQDWQRQEKGKLFESEAYRNGQFGKEIGGLDDAKQVIDEKSKTEAGKLDLPTIPEIRSGSTGSDEKGGKP